MNNEPQTAAQLRERGWTNEQIYRAAVSALLAPERREKDGRLRWEFRPMRDWAEIFEATREAV